MNVLNPQIESKEQFKNGTKAILMLFLVYLISNMEKDNKILLDISKFKISPYQAKHAKKIIISWLSNEKLIIELYIAKLIPC